MTTETELETLRTAYKRTLSAIDAQSKNVEDYPTSPYAEATAKTLTAQAKALRLIGDEIRALEA